MRLLQGVPEDRSPGMRILRGDRVETPASWSRQKTVTQGGIATPLTELGTVAVAKGRGNPLEEDKRDANAVNHT
jgi:hypothetical protein